MDTITNGSQPAPETSPAARSERRSHLPKGFDVEAWTREACERSGVSVAVTDPLVLSKLRVLTRRKQQKRNG